MQKRRTADAFAVPHLRQKRVFDASGAVTVTGLADLGLVGTLVGVGVGECAGEDRKDDRDDLFLEELSLILFSGKNMVVIHHSLSSSGSM